MIQWDLQFPLDSWVSKTKRSRQSLLFKQNRHNHNSEALAAEVLISATQ